MPDVEWTDATVAALAQWRREGLTASQIAARIPNATRNSIIGKLFRMNDETIPKHTERSQMGAAAHSRGSSVLSTLFGKRGKLGPRIRSGKLPKDQTPDDMPDMPTGILNSFAALTKESCVWPLGDPQDEASFRFCGARKDGTHRNYCPFHASIERQPKKERTA